MTFEQKISFLNLLKKWIYSGNQDDLVLLLKFLEITDKELYNKYNHVSLEDFFEVRKRISHIPNDLFFELYKKHYAYDPIFFAKFNYEQEWIPKKRSWWQKR